MHLYKKCFFLGMLIAAPLFSAEYSEFMRERMLGDLEFINNIFQANYAPEKWKKRFCGWDLAYEIAHAKERVLQKNNLGLKEFHYILKDFFKSAKDYHVFAQFYSTETAILPFMIQHAEEKYFFVHIDRGQLSQDASFPFTEGDELLSVDGKPIQEEIQAFMERELGDNFEGTDRALAEIYFTTRMGKLGHIVPKGTVTLEGIKAITQERVRCQVEWIYIAEDVTPLYKPSVCKMVRSAVQDVQLTKGGAASRRGVSHDPFFNKQLIFPQYDALVSARADEEDPTDMIGSKQSFLPFLGEVLWESTDTDNFHAYLFALPGKKKAGYVRIPVYRASDYDKAVKEFARIIQYFEKEADALVIDQLSNPGGVLLYMYALVSMLSDKPLDVPKHRQMIMQEDVFYASEEKGLLEGLQNDEQARDVLGNTILGLPVNYEISQKVLSYYQFLIDEWNLGRLMTAPGYVYGIGPIQPHSQARFTKPLLILVNELDFSGGDFFPAIFQDNKRATILGTRTAGAGGIVTQVTFPNLSGISEFCYTSSIAERQNHILIENAGVTPDVFYELSQNDLQHDYADYVEKIQHTIGLIIRGEK